MAPQNKPMHLCRQLEHYPKKQNQKNIFELFEELKTVHQASLRELSEIRAAQLLKC